MIFIHLSELAKKKFGRGRVLAGHQRQLSQRLGFALASQALHFVRIAHLFVIHLFRIQRLSFDTAERGT
jgi:hypothetical protein